MAFEKAMAMMGGKKSGIGGTIKGSGDKPKPAGKIGGEPSEDGGGSLTLHDHGDGTFHTEHEDGEKVEHPHLGHALMHIAHHHEPDGKHMHIHHDGFSATSHAVNESGEHDGPREHEDMQGVHDHVDQMLGGGGEEPENAEDQSLGGYGGE